MRRWLATAACLSALVFWYSWFFRYQPFQGSLLLDHWRGEVINLQGGVTGLEEHRRLSLERREQERLQRLEKAKKASLPNTPQTVTPEEHIEHIRQLLQEGQGLPGGASPAPASGE